MATPFPLRHPELVSGSISAFTRSYRRQSKACRKVVPVCIVAFDQIDLPLTVPTLQLFFPRDGRGHVFKQFVTHQPMDGIAAREASAISAPVLPKSCSKVTRHTDVERAKRLAGKDVNAGLALEMHEPVIAGEWTLKQVQGDDRDGV